MDISLYIDGQSRPASNGAVFERKNPISGEVVTRAPAATAADVDAAVDAASRAFADWSRTSPSDRRKILLKAADILEEKAGEFQRLVVAETGSTRKWGYRNAMNAAPFLREAAALTTQVTGEVIPSNVPGTLALAIRQPVGVCLGIAPWNAPIILAVRAVAFAIAFGNTAILKAAEQCPATHRLIGDVFHEAGLPAGVLNIITNDLKDAASVVSALVTHPRVKRVNFTGSTRVGGIIAGLCARHLKPALLELGGKSPFIVLDDADLKAAAQAAAFGAFLNQGQICMSTERIIVQNAVADEFVGLLADHARRLKVGNPSEDVDLGSLIELSAAERMERVLVDAKEKGATLVVGGERKGAIISPAVVDHVTPDMKIYSEESFGPVKPIIRVADDDEAVRIANDTEYGLSASVYSRDIQRAMAIAGRLETGVCHINGATVQDEPQMPFGGVKQSGYGRFGGKAVISEFTELRWITIDDPARAYSI